MVSLLTTVGALTFDPGFRGILVVAVGVAVLMGSVFVLLSTNTGIRVGGMIALTGFFGWMFIMALIWSMYGIGYKGPAPTWKVKELSFNTQRAELPIARSLPAADALPDPKVFLEKDPSLARQFAGVPKPPNLGDLLGVDPQLIKQINTGKDWQLLATSDPQTGDAAATASAFLGADQQNICPTSADCVLLEAYSHGGKAQRTDDSILGRIWYKITSAFTVKNPPHYAVIQFRKAVPQTTLPGAAPPIPVADNTQPVMSVILERDIGSKRLPSILLTILMGTCFLVCCSVLHHREKILARNRAGA